MYLKIVNWGGLYFLGNVLRSVSLLMVIWAIAQFKTGVLLHTTVFVVVAFLPLVLNRHFLPPILDFLLVLTVFITTVAGTTGLYMKLVWFDDFLHVLAPAVATFIFVYLLKIRSQDKIPIWLLVLSSASFGITLEALWEIYELTSSYLFAPEIIPALEDIVSDLSLAVLGSSLAALISFRYLSQSAKDNLYDTGVRKDKLK